MVTMLKVYQTELLTDLAIVLASGDPHAELLDETGATDNFTLCMSCCTVSPL